MINHFSTTTKSSNVHKIVVAQLLPQKKEISIHTTEFSKIIIFKIIHHSVPPQCCETKTCFPHVNGKFIPQTPKGTKITAMDSLLKCFKDKTPKTFGWWKIGKNKQSTSSRYILTYVSFPLPLVYSSNFSNFPKSFVVFFTNWFKQRFASKLHSPLISVMQSAN